MSETGLLPCPFCGEEAVSTGNGEGDFWVECDGCAGATTCHRTPDAAVQAWNERPANSHDALVKALEQVLATGLNGGNNVRLAFMAASRDVLSAEDLARAEASEAAVNAAREALLMAKGGPQ